MKIVRAAVVAMLIVLGVSLSGCGGGGAEVRSTAHMTTLGQELKDLKEAYDRGLLSEKEYNEAKKKIIEQRTQ